MYAPELLEQDDTEAPPRIGYGPLAPMRVNPDGSIDAVFPGGLEIPIPADSQLHPEKSIRWVELTTGVLLADIEVLAGTGGALNSTFQVGANNAGSDSSLEMLAGDGATGRWFAALQLDADEVAGEAFVFAVARNSAGGHATAYIVRASDGASDFLRLATIGTRAVDFGSSSVTWPGASPSSSIKTVAHGLGRTPAAILVQGVGGFAFWRSQSPTAAQFDVLARSIDGTSPAVGTQQFFYWLAIG